MDKPTFFNVECNLKTCCIDLCPRVYNVEHCVNCPYMKLRRDVLLDVEEYFRIDGVNGEIDDYVFRIRLYQLPYFKKISDLIKTYKSHLDRNVLVGGSVVHDIYHNRLHHMYRPTVVQLGSPLRESKITGIVQNRGEFRTSRHLDSVERIFCSYMTTKIDIIKSYFESVSSHSECILCDDTYMYASGFALVSSFYDTFIPKRFHSYNPNTYPSLNYFGFTNNNGHIREPTPIDFTKLFVQNNANTEMLKDYLIKAFFVYQTNYIESHETRVWTIPLKSTVFADAFSSCYH